VTIRIHSKRPPKYRNQPTVCDGIRFHSHKEAARWAELCLLRDRKIIKDLHRQFRYDIVVNGVPVCRYIADFVYLAWDEFMGLQ
jgi:hypothetical protein